MMVSVLVAALLCLSQLSLTDPWVLAGWFGVFFTVSAARILLVSFYKKSASFGTADNTEFWHRWFLVGTYAVAVVWGTSAIILFPENNPANQTIFFVIIAGMAAGAVSSLCQSLPAVSGFLCLLLIPLAAKMFLQQTGETQIVGILVILYLMVNITNAMKLNRTIKENIQLRLQSIEREKILKTNEERYRHIFRYAPLGIFQYDTESTIVDCNDTFINILGSSKENLIGFNMFSSIQDRRLLNAVKNSLDVGVGYFEGDYVSVTADKTTPVRVFFKAISSSDKTILGGVGIVEDFTEKRLSEQQIRYHTTYDFLTGLPNRRLLLHQLRHEISRAARHGHLGALLFIDLDNFKTINDSLGHTAGDDLLKIVSKRIADNIRAEDCAARMGGDEFIIIVTELGETIDLAADKARVVADKLRVCLSAPCLIAGREMHITPSIGVSLFPKPGLKSDDILKQADAAMYRAKAAGRNEICFFLPSMQKAADDRLRLNTDIRKALLQDELTLFFQPQVTMSGDIVGAEALLRWNHPERGLLAPGTFLPVIEGTSLMGEIDRWVLLTACKQIKKWTDMNLLQDRQSISVNISGKEFTAPDFIETVAAILKQTAASPNHLGIELTESSLISTGSEIVERIMTLRQMGIKFSVDDFGTGYSSLSYLKKLPLHTLKIDRSFVNDIQSADQQAVLVDTIIMMARNLELDVVAEGVESERELIYLHAKGCQYYQGYYFSRPSSVPSFTKMLEAGHISPFPSG